MSVTSFRAIVRNAGSLESENRINASFRSLNKYDQTLPRSKYDEILKEEKFDIEPVKETPPQPPNNNDEEKKERKKHRKHRENSKDTQNVRESRRRSKNREEKTTEKKIKESGNPLKNEDEEIMETFKRMASNRQRRAERNNSDEKNSEKENLKTNKLEDKVENHGRRDVLRSSSTNLATKKIAFEAPKPDSESEDEGDAKVSIEKQKSRSTPNNLLPGTNSTLSNSEYFKSIKFGDTLDFTLTPPPQGQMIHGKIICKKGLFNEYYFYLENICNSDLFLMKASRKMTSAKSYYTIDTINYDQYGKASTTEISCARIVSNMSRKKFKLDLSTNFVQFNNTEILNIAFKTNVGDPRKILSSASLCQGTKNSTNDRVTYFLKNKQPVFSMEQKKYVLNYNGRAKRSSKNNFQIIDESSPDDILMQLGKVETTHYSCDFSFPICALQAFGFALSNLCR
ncbi:unnamed protein product [Brachionus calyciflorus]|uniref:Tubby C-terminal domain-containing protein n=1 Tax=Brachionus calyciflorus TaxID=104777 RepID=A0A813MDF1_9BILA|nr:unnamed protein product [Brachionus calyciflorus]